MINVHQCVTNGSKETEGRSAMTDRDDSDGIADADSKAVAACVRTLNHTIGQLANHFGAAAVVAALTEVVGCSACVGDVNRGIRALVERITMAR
jgi:hypothetical protein